MLRIALVRSLSPSRHPQPCPQRDPRKEDALDAASSALACSAAAFLAAARNSRMRSVALAFAAVCCPPAAGVVLRSGRRATIFSASDMLLVAWNVHEVVREVGLPPEKGSMLQGSPYMDAFGAALIRRREQGLFPPFIVPMPPLSPDECFDREMADLADAGWAAFQSACCDMRGTLSTLLTEGTGQLTQSVSVQHMRGMLGTLLTEAAVSIQQRGPPDQTGGHPDHRASLEALAGSTITKAASFEALAAVPESEYEKDLERVYERKAALAVLNRLREEGRRLKLEGKLRGAEEAFARARKARAAYLGLCRESFLHFLDDLSQAGWTGKYYADRIKGMDADIDQMRRSCVELRGQGKRQAAEEIIARRWQLETQRRLLIEELGVMGPEELTARCIEVQKWLFYEEMDGEDREVLYRYFKMDDDRGVPRGTTYQFERALAAPPARRAA